MSDDRMLREQVREAIRSGRLPISDPARTWGGRGSGASCTICGKRIQTRDVEIEVEFASVQNGDAQHAGNGNSHAGNGNGHAGNGNGHAGNDGVYMHLLCFTAWECERRETIDNQLLTTLTGLRHTSESGTINAREDRLAHTDDFCGPGGPR